MCASVAEDHHSASSVVVINYVNIIGIIMVLFMVTFISG